MSIEVQNITKKFGAFTALDQVDLTVPSGELVALLGPSGSGKTTLLRIIAGLETPDAGRILFEGEEATNWHVRKRQVGFVFQHYALFRHLTVFDNVAFGLTVKPRRIRPGKKEIRERVMNLLHLVQLDSMADRFPSQLSGGQRQRVALARALAVEPKVMLLDEPFGALDAQVRQELRHWLRRLHSEIHVTSVFVTHDQEEALEVADRIVVMNQARIEQIGKPEEVYENPVNPFVFNFLGNVNLFHSRGQISEEIRTPGGGDHTPGEASNDRGPRIGYVRPYDVQINKNRDSVDDIEAEVQFIRGAGIMARIELKRLDNDHLVEAALSHDRYQELKLQKGEIVFIRPKNMRVFVPDYQI